MSYWIVGPEIDVKKITDRIDALERKIQNMEDQYEEDRDTMLEMRLQLGLDPNDPAPPPADDAAKWDQVAHALRMAGAATYYERDATAVPLARAAVAKAIALGLAARVEALERQMAIIGPSLHATPTVTWTSTGNAPTPAPAGDDAMRWPAENDMYLLVKVNEYAPLFRDADDDDVAAEAIYLDHFNAKLRHLGIQALEIECLNNPTGMIQEKAVALGLADPPGGRRVEVTDAMVDRAIEAFHNTSATPTWSVSVAMRAALKAALATHDAPRKVSAGESMDDKPDAFYGGQG